MPSLTSSRIRIRHILWSQDSFVVAHYVLLSARYKRLHPSFHLFLVPLSGNMMVYVFKFTSITIALQSLVDQEKYDWSFSLTLDSSFSATGSGENHAAVLSVCLSPTGVHSWWRVGGGESNHSEGENVSWCEYTSRKEWKAVKWIVRKGRWNDL